MDKFWGKRGEKYKVELINDFNQPTVTYCSHDNFVDLCRGGHAERPAHEIAKDSFTLDRIAGAYWRGDEKNPQLTRIYGLAFDTKDALEAYQLQREEAKKQFGAAAHLILFPSDAAMLARIRTSHV